MINRSTRVHHGGRPRTTTFVVGLVSHVGDIVLSLMVVEVDAARSDLRGAEFGPYKIVRRLGAGGMAETFEATRSGPNDFAQRVCLKLALPSLREEAQFVQLFEREAKLAAQLRHSNIVGVLDYGHVDEIFYMALELVDGVDLLALLMVHGRLSFEHVALLGIELAKALDHAECHGILHRDVSPSNVMLSAQGEVMLTDFGVAKAMAGSSQQETAPTIMLPDGRVKGKVPYMSPEQLRNDPLDGRSDLFALGVLLFESLTGSRPFDAGNDPGTIMKILRGEHFPCTELAPTAPVGLCNVVDSLLDPEPGRRPSSASALVELLDDFAPSPRAQRDLGTMVAQLHRDSLPVVASEAAGVSGNTFVRRGNALESGVTLKDNARSAPSGGTNPRSRRRYEISVPLAVALVVALLVGVYLFVLRAG